MQAMISGRHLGNQKQFSNLTRIQKYIKRSRELLRSDSENFWVLNYASNMSIAAVWSWCALDPHLLLSKLQSAFLF